MNGHINISGKIDPALIGAVPTSRTINGKPLSADVVLTATDIGGKNTIASGVNSHAEGDSTAATGECSHAEGGSGTAATGTYSHAEGELSIAESYCSHAEGSGTMASGGSSHAEGSLTHTFGDCSHAEGISTTARGEGSHAEGKDTTTSGNNAHAEGGSVTVDLNKYKLGIFESVSTYAPDVVPDVVDPDTPVTPGPIPINVTTEASGENSHAEGAGTKAWGDGSHTEGKYTISAGSNSHTEGDGCRTFGTDSHAEGLGTIVHNPQMIFDICGVNLDSNTFDTNIIEEYPWLCEIFSYSLGDTQNPTPPKILVYKSEEDYRIFTVTSITDGCLLTVKEEIPADWASNGVFSARAVVVDVLYSETWDEYFVRGAHAEGCKSKALSNGAHSEGLSTSAAGHGSHAEGKDTVASGSVSHSEGIGTTASGIASHTEGIGTTALEEASHAEGGAYPDREASKAMNYAAHAEGASTTASGKYSHSEGCCTIASGVASHAEGNSAVASGGNSHAEGYDTTASAGCSHAEGGSFTGKEGSKATAYAAHAEGISTTASGKYSHSEGSSTIASGQNSHAEGSGTIASGTTSHAEGGSFTGKVASKATAYASHAEGVSTTSSGQGSHAEGSSTIACGDSAHVEGKICFSTCKFGHAEGNGSIATSPDSILRIASYDVTGKTFTFDTSDADYSKAFANLVENVKVTVLYTTDSKSLSAQTFTIVSSDSDSNTALVKEDIPDSNFNPSYMVILTAGSTVSAHAEGFYTIASGNYSHAEGDMTFALARDSHAEGNKTRASREDSHAEGCSTTASDWASHAEGISTEASGQGAHAEGCSTTASGYYAHVEGNSTTASGQESHAEGASTKASGNYSHAEGIATRALGQQSHAEGSGAISSGESSHAEGYHTTSDNYAAHACGKYNRAMTTGGSYSNTTGDAMVIGCGIGPTSLSNCFRVTYTGSVYGLSAFNSTGADYAEYFEWLDGNPNAEDRVGLFVTLDGDKIRPANPGEYLLGIVSGQPCIIGNADEDWLGRWEHDEFERFIMEDVETPVTDIQMVEVPVLDENGNPTGQTRPEMKEVETGEVIHGTRFKANPNYDASKPYVERHDRPEWSAIGMMGVLSVRDDGTCKVNSYCQVAEGGIATAAASYIPGQTYRVIKRVSDKVVKVIFR